MKKIFFIFLLLLQAQPAFAVDKIRIVATTSTFASIANAVAGDKADIHFIAPANRDVHFITPSPKDVVKTKKADVFIHGGLDLELWRDPLLNAVGRTDFFGEDKSAIDVSHGVNFLDVPDELSRLEGDIHAFGNPHYWMDPANTMIIADNIAGGLARLYPEDAEIFKRNAETFKMKLGRRSEEWKAGFAAHQGKSIVAYHNCWPYLTGYLGITTAGFLEPKPGITPTGGHLQRLAQQMREKNVTVIVHEIFQESRTPAKLAKETGASVVVLTQEPGKGKDYIQMFEENLSKLQAAFAKA